VPASQLGKYLRDNVTISKVTSSKPRKVFFVTRPGQVIARRISLKKGDAIFVLKDTGEPLLVQACGNPVLKKLPPRVQIQSRALPSYQVLRPNEVPRTLAAPSSALPPLAAQQPQEAIAPLVPLAPPTPVTVTPGVPGGHKFRFRC